MISSVGLVPPIVYPQPDPADYASAAAAITVTAAGESPLAVDVTVAPEQGQTLPDGTPLPLGTIIAPHQARVFYLPAGTTLIMGVWPTAVGPFLRDAWVVDALADRSGIAGLFPPTTPAPVYWVLEGVLRTSVDDPANSELGLLDQWLRGEAPGVTPRAQECHDKTDPGQQAGTPEETWKAAMLAGTWAELVPAETALGLVAPPPDAGTGTAGVLTIWACSADGTLLPTAGILAAFAGIDRALLDQHPVVAACQPLTSNLPVQFFVRFDAWDVDGVSPDDGKGDATALQPDRVDLIDADSGNAISGATWTWPGPHGVVVIPRNEIAGKSFWLQAGFASGVRIHLERGTQRFHPDPAGSWTWSTAASVATDGTTPGTWRNFDGIQVGTQTEPATFWVGTRVRLAMAYQQQPRDWYGNHDSNGALTTHRVAAGHAVHLFRADSTRADAFVTDDDGEVSGVSFDVQPGDTITAGLVRRLDLDPVNGGDATVLLVVDDPTTAPSLFPDEYFHSENARIPVRFQVVTGGEIGAANGPAIVVIDADKTDDRRGNTVHAAAFHALKYARFANDAVTVLKGDSSGLPQLHEFRLRYTTSAVASADTTVRLSASGGQPFSYTQMAAAGSWFTSPTVMHEYGHALAAWLGSVLDDQARYKAYENATGAIFDRLESEMHYRTGRSIHNEGLVSNSGVALSEGLALLFECLLGCYGRLTDGRTTKLAIRPQTPPLGQEGWQKYTYAVRRHDASGTGLYMSLSADSGRRVESVFAAALFGYITQATGFPGFLVEQNDTESGSRPPQALLDDWKDSLPVDQQASGPDQLRRLFAWLVTGAISGVYGGPVSNWTGRWPASGGTSYPTVYDYLKQLQDSDPDKSGTAPTPEESFQQLFELGLLRWNLEPADPNEPTPPVLAPDPPSPDWPP